ncbi:MAG TPA: cupin domain-containing protein [Solirubrobacterales bacterium]|nr:cupin domain-containing protein [Solirubrobacterales bacterium]
MPEPNVTIAVVDPEAGEPFQRIRRELGVESFGINALTLRPGQRNRVHIHARQEEVYLVLDGELTLVVEGDPLKLTPGHLARVGASVRRQLTNTSARPTTILALGAYGDHESRDALAWTSWDEEGEGRSPADVPLPDDLPVPDR